MVSSRFLAGAAAVMLLFAGCGPARTAEEADEIPDQADAPGAALSGKIVDTAAAPDPAALLPPLEGYRIDDTADPGELRSSLDHGEVPYLDVRRRLILDEEGFTSGAVTVVTFRPGSGGPASFLDHHHGDAPRVPVELGGVEMLRIEAEPHDVLAWTEPGFVMMFERGQEVSDRWVEELARATVQTISRNRRGSGD